MKSLNFNSSFFIYEIYNKIPSPIAILCVANKYLPYEVPNLFIFLFFVSIPYHISISANWICEYVNIKTPNTICFVSIANIADEIPKI